MDAAQPQTVNKGGRPPTPSARTLERVVGKFLIEYRASGRILPSCKASGFAFSTYKRWTAKGRKNPDSAYGRFVEAAEVAYAGYQAEQKRQWEEYERRNEEQREADRRQMETWKAEQKAQLAAQQKRMDDLMAEVLENDRRVQEEIAGLLGG